MMSTNTAIVIRRTMRSLPGDDALQSRGSSFDGVAFVSARTRVVTACHANISLLVTFGYCPATTIAPPIAVIDDAANVVGQMIVSFLTGRGETLAS